MNTSTFLLIAIHLEILHISANQDKIVQCRLYIVPVIMYRDVWMHSTSGAYGTFSASRIQLNASNSEVRSKTGQPPITTTAVHCEHPSTQLVTGDGREDALVRPGYQLSVMILNISTLVYTQLTVKHKIVLYGG